ncbi:MAG: hypothetical protein ACLVB5_15700 [Christensenellales bacterium]
MRASAGAIALEELMFLPAAEAEGRVLARSLWPETLGAAWLRPILCGKDGFAARRPARVCRRE